MPAPREARPFAEPPGADVWHVSLDAERELPGTLDELLDERERTQAGRFRDPTASRRYVVAHVAARTVLGGYLGTAADALRWSTGPHGKPAFEGPDDRWRWSLSRSGPHALIAVCLSTPIGVDIEQVGTSTPALALAARFLPPPEAAEVAELAARAEASDARALYHRLLSRKEACVKASGGRLLDGLDLRVLTQGPVRGTGRFTGQRWMLRDLAAPPGFVAALATITAPAHDAAVAGPAPMERDRLRFFEWTWQLAEPGAETGPEPHARDGTGPGVGRGASRGAHWGIGWDAYRDTDRGADPNTRRNADCVHRDADRGAHHTVSPGSRQAPDPSPPRGGGRASPDRSTR